MWKYLAIQGLLFFLFFQPDLVGSLTMRILLIVISLFAVIMTWVYAPMDPFVWILYGLGIALTYLCAQKTLRWVAFHKQRLRDELADYERKSSSSKRIIEEKDLEIQTLQADINHVSMIYDKVKEMSRSLVVLDAFVDLSEALVENFNIKKTRLLMLEPQKQTKWGIDRVYHLDHKHVQFTSQDKSLLSQDAMYRGEVYPYDLRLVEIMSREMSPKAFWSKEDAERDLKINLPADAENLIVIPVKTGFSLNAVLTLEGASRKDFSNLGILTDRFLAEFQRIKLYADVQRLAITDWLTGAYVRRYFFKRLEEEIVRSTRFNLKFSFLMLDLDDFKKCNDQHGHLVGDAILKQTVELIQETLREVDLVGRYGGEEFAAILLDTDEGGAMYVAERIRKGIENKVFQAYDLNLKMTVSIGLATYQPSLQEAGEIVEWADSALYQAKRQGKNKVCAYINR